MSYSSYIALNVRVDAFSFVMPNLNPYHTTTSISTRHSTSRRTTLYVSSINKESSLETTPTLSFNEKSSTSSSTSRIPKIHFDSVEELIAPKPTYTINVEAEKSSSIMKRKIVHLLSDDEGEEDDELPDYSEEAANEIAHKSAYSRISEEAKWKANYAMQKMEKQKNQSDRFVAVSAEAVVSSRNSRKTNAINREESSLLFGDENNVVVKKKRRVTASVKETGVDTMSQYVKSMGSHELLPKESEILLGKQIQVLVKWENIRQELEEELSG